MITDSNDAMFEVQDVSPGAQVDNLIKVIVEDWDSNSVNCSSTSGSDDVDDDREMTVCEIDLAGTVQVSGWELVGLQTDTTVSYGWTGVALDAQDTQMTLFDAEVMDVSTVSVKALSESSDDSGDFEMNATLFYQWESKVVLDFDLAVESMNDTEQA